MTGGSPFVLFVTFVVKNHVSPLLRAKVGAMVKVEELIVITTLLPMGQAHGGREGSDGWIPILPRLFPDPWL